MSPGGLLSTGTGDSGGAVLGGLVVGSIYGLVGMGYTGVYNVTRIVNFAQGDFAMIGALGAIALHELGAPLPAHDAQGGQVLPVQLAPLQEDLSHDGLSATTQRGK